MKAKKLLCAVLACMILVGCFASCGNETNTPPETQPPAGSVQVDDAPAYDANGYLNDNLPNLNYGDEVINILTWNPALDELCLVEEDGIGIIEDAMFRQLTGVEERLHVDIQIKQEKGQQEHQTTYLQLIENASNTDEPFDVVGAYSGIGASGAIRGLFHNLSGVQYLDFDMPWWPEDLRESIAINGNLYFASGDISPNLIYGLFAILVNNDMLVTHYQSTEFLYELASEGNWTLEELLKYSKDIYDDVNNPGEKDDTDQFGFVFSNSVSIDAFLQGCGIDITTKNSDGKMVMSSTFFGQQCDSLVNQLAAFLKSEDCIIAKNYAGIFPEGRALFMDAKIEVCITKLTNSTFEYGVLPIPKFDTAQSEYVTTMNHNFSVYSIPTCLSTDEANRAGAVIEALASSGYRNVAPAIFEKAFKLKYSANPTVAEMYQIVHDSVKFDMGRLYRLNFNPSFIPDTMFRNAVRQEKNWVAYIASCKGQWAMMLDHIYQQLA